MSHCSRYRLRHALRASLLLVFAVCLAMQPVLAALGEVHESTAHAASAGPHLDHLTPHEGAQNGDAEQGGAGTLHILLHHAHCCGHTVALAAVEFAAPTVVLTAVQLLPPASPHLAASHLTTPFRPPILV